MPYPFLEPGLSQQRQAAISVVKDGVELATVQATGLPPRGPLPGFTVQSVPIPLDGDLLPPFEVHIVDVPTGLSVTLLIVDRVLKSGQQLTFDCSLRIAGIPH